MAQKFHWPEDLSYCVCSLEMGLQDREYVFPALPREHLIPKKGGKLPPY